MSEETVDPDPAKGDAAAVSGTVGRGEAAPKGEVILETRAVVAGYVPEVDILRGVDLDLRRGEIVTIVGPNGAGKSTLLKSVFGLLHPREGAIRFKGEDIGRLKPNKIAARGLSYVPQLDNVFKTLTVEENLEMGAVVRPDVDRAERMAQMFEIFPRLGERRKQAAGTMSGGERQMVAMAKALMPDPELILLDEPSAGLAPQFVDAIFERVVAINAAGVSVLMVEQNARRALEMSDRGYVLDLGTNAHEGPGRALLDDPKVSELYLGGRRLGG